MIPYVSDFFPSSVEKLIFYTEIYDTDKILGENEGFLLRYYIENYNTQMPLNDFNMFKRQTAAPITVVFKEFNISELPSGNYNLVIEARDRENQLLKAKRFFFQRSNPGVDIDLKDISTINITNTFVYDIMDVDTLSEYINSLYPISEPKERQFAKNQLKAQNLKLMQQYFYNFWYKRNNLNPEEEWNIYKRQLQYVNKHYSTMIKKGYETDRGRVYLQYGPPNNLVERKHEPGVYPYEIWHYYKINDQNNKKFVFYNPDIVGNEYALLHSDVRGEIGNRNWEMILHRRQTPLYDYRETDADKHWGTKARTIFDKQ